MGKFYKATKPMFLIRLAFVDWLRRYLLYAWASYEMKTVRTWFLSKLGIRTQRRYDRKMLLILKIELHAIRPTNTCQEFSEISFPYVLFFITAIMFWILVFLEERKNEEHVNWRFAKYLCKTWEFLSLMKVVFCGANFTWTCNRRRP